MRDKYYTPSIEEFHVGFEYEESYDKGKTWNKNRIEYFYEFEELKSTLDYDLTRVKYLDKEDIESLGFIYNHPDQYFKEDLVLLIDDDYFIQLFLDRKRNLSSNVYLFQGTIKNKSELIKLLKQLGIDESK